jgi:hypothetical protein
LRLPQSVDGSFCEISAQKTETAVFQFNGAYSVFFLWNPGEL